MTRSSDTTRRGFLSTAAALAASAAVTAPSAAIEADPIFAAIEVHKAATVALLGISDQHVALERAGLRGRLGAKHDSDLAECEARMDAAFDVQTDAACALISAPTTMAGVIALLQYATATDTDGEMWPRELRDDDDTKTRSWHHFLIEMLADVLSGLAVQS